MFEIKSTALYTRIDLIDMLSPLGIDADGWIARIKPVKRFRQVWLGKDLLDAVDRAPPLGEGREKKVSKTRTHRKKMGSKDHIVSKTGSRLLEFGKNTKNEAKEGPYSR